MIANNKQVAKNTLLLYIRMLITLGIGLYTSRVVLAALGEIDFGIYNVVGGFVAMFTIISGAMTTATQRFLSYEIGKGEEGDMHSIFSTIVIIHAMLVGIILIFAETVGVWFLNTYLNFPPERYAAANWVFQFSLLTLLVNIVSVPYNAAIIAYEKMSAYAYISIIEVSLKLLIVYLIVISSYDKLIVYSILLATVTIVIRIVYGLYCNRHFDECRCSWKWNKEHGGKMMTFVGWNMIGSVAGVAKEQGINIVLNMFFGAAINAARGIAYQVLGAVNGFVNNFQMAMNPQITKLYAAKERKSMFDMVLMGSKYSYVLLLTLSLPIIIETPYILSLWLKEVPDYTSVFLRLVLVTALIDSLSGTLITSMHASGKVRDFQIIVGGISLLTLPIAYIMFNLGYPPYMAMVVSLFISLICLFARLLLLKRSIGFPVRKFMTTILPKVTAITILSPILPYLAKIAEINRFWSFLLVGMTAVLSTLLCSYAIGLDGAERKFVRSKAALLWQRLFFRSAT